MISGLKRRIDTFFGRGEAAVTVPPLDGALRANTALDEAALRLPLPDVDSLAAPGGVVHAAAGARLFALENGAWQERLHLDAPVTAMAELDGGLALALALADGTIRFHGGPRAGERLETGLGCITALAAAGGALVIANGSARHGTGQWQHDLMERGATGSVWRLEGAGPARQIAGGLAWAGGLAVDTGGIVVAESWRHRLLRVDSGQVLLSDLPAYPGRLSAAPDGWWLAAFAPRSQLVEFVLREPGYRKRMIAGVEPDFWVAPRLRSGRSFYESLQGGGVKQLGKLKPWAPTMSAGICIHLDANFQPRTSLQSRADGHTHGVTAAVQAGDLIHVAARGDGVVVALPAGGTA